MVFNFFKKKNKGFTLVEMLVATGILLVLLIVAVVNFRFGNQAQELRLKGTQTVSDLRGMQNNALSAQAAPSGGVPRAFGVHFVETAGSYILFAKTGGTNWLYDNGVNSENIKTVSLGGNIIINGMNDPEQPCGTHIQPGVMDIVFTVPAGEIFINGIQPDGTCGAGYSPPSWIGLYHRSSGRTLRVETNWISGQISASNLD